MYAILDIETTGGKFDEEGITEIAIYQFDGHQITDQFVSLVNPEKPIQPFVVNLTKITQKMLVNAPKFYEVAKRIVEITTDCVVVAHNASFDYRILQTEFRRLGFEFNRTSLCTVSLSKKLIPDMESYKLGKLVRSLGIPMSDRHRASGDAKATVELFKILLSKDIDKQIIKTHLKNNIETALSGKFLEMLTDLPTTTGVYYLHNEKGDIIYIGKGNDIKKRVRQHLTGTQRKSLKIQLEIAGVTFEETGSELIALLKENDEIKRHKPKNNRALKNSMMKLGLLSEVNTNGYINLKLTKYSDSEKYHAEFKNLNEARRLLFHFTEKHKLCQRLTQVDPGENACFNVSINKCFGACKALEPIEDYNQRVFDLFEEFKFPYSDMVVIDKGRAVDERCVILIEDDEFKGFSYVNLNHQINTIEILRSLIRPMKNNRDARHIIQQYLRKSKSLKIIKLNPQSKL